HTRSKRDWSSDVCSSALENIRMPAQGKYYSVNEAYHDEFPQAYRTYLARIRNGGLGRRYSTRYVGSMVADIHRTLLKGGIFLYQIGRASCRGRDCASGRS